MSKSDQKKTKSTNELLTESMNTYDGTNYVYDGSDNTINTEQDMINKYNKPKVQTWDAMKQTARAEAKKGNYKDLRDIRKIERKMSKPFKKTPIETRRESSNTVSDTALPLDFSLPKFKKNFTPEDDTLKRIEEDRNKVDPDFFRGLGTFFIKRY